MVIQRMKFVAIYLHVGYVYPYIVYGPPLFFGVFFCNFAPPPPPIAHFQSQEIFATVPAMLTLHL